MCRGDSRTCPCHLAGRVRRKRYLPQHLKISWDFVCLFFPGTSSEGRLAAGKNGRIADRWFSVVRGQRPPRKNFTIGHPLASVSSRASTTAVGLGANQAPEKPCLGPARASALEFREGVAPSSCKARTRAATIGSLAGERPSDPRSRQERCSPGTSTLPEAAVANEDGVGVFLKRSSSTECAARLPCSISGKINRVRTVRQRSFSVSKLVNRQKARPGSVPAADDLVGGFSANTGSRHIGRFCGR